MVGSSCPKCSLSVGFRGLEYRPQGRGGGGFTVRGTA